MTANDAVDERAGGADGSSTTVIATTATSTTVPQVSTNILNNYSLQFLGQHYTYFKPFGIFHLGAYQAPNETDFQQTSTCQQKLNFLSFLRHGFAVVAEVPSKKCTIHPHSADHNPQRRLLLSSIAVKSHNSRNSSSRGPSKVHRGMRHTTPGSRLILSSADIHSVLVETNGDIELAATRISEGQFSE